METHSPSPKHQSVLLVEVGTCAIFPVYVGTSTTVINKLVLVRQPILLHEYFVISVHII